jgi:hypothetical protein
VASSSSIRLAGLGKGEPGFAVAVGGLCIGMFSQVLKKENFFPKMKPTGYLSYIVRQTESDLR